MRKQVGILALRTGNLLPLEVLELGEGRFYLGTRHPDLGPVTRESEEVFRTRGDAERCMQDGDWTQRSWPPDGIAGTAPIQGTRLYA